MCAYWWSGFRMRIFIKQPSTREHWSRLRSIAAASVCKLIGRRDAGILLLRDFIVKTIDITSKFCTIPFSILDSFNFVFVLWIAKNIFHCVSINYKSFRIIVFTSINCFALMSPKKLCFFFLSVNEMWSKVYSSKL